MAKKGLGNGLSALFSEKPVLNEKLAGERVVFLKLSDVKPNPNQPRQFFDDEKLKELVASIKEQGVLQPILVCPQGEKSYQIIAGERRYRAAGLGGLKEIPAIVRDMSDEAILEVALIENIQRENLNPMEEALTYRELMDKYGYTQAKLGAKLGKSRVYVANIVRLLALPEQIRAAIAGGQLTGGHGKALLQLDNAKDMLALGDKIIAEGMSVRQAEEYAKNPAEIYKKPIAKPKAKPAKVEKPKEFDDLMLSEIGERLRSRLGTKVTVQKVNEKQGKIVLEYYNNEDLDRLLAMLLPGETF